ncbi:MAG: hypothetical protein HZB16_24650 [Armatimonadetes bacterium]|nr:hypothetical protein [Armatimonadota bacterium]
MVKGRCAAWMGRLVAVTMLSLLGACGSGGGGGTPQQETGSVTVRITWPAAAGRLVPYAAASVVVTLRDGSGTALGSATLNKPQTSRTLTGIAAGTGTLDCAAYPQANGAGTALSSGSTPFSLAGGGTVDVPVAMGSSIASFAVTPNPAPCTVGGTVTLTATARNSAGQVVLLPDDAANHWSVVSGSGFVSLVAARSASTWTRTVSGTAAGTAVVCATLTEAPGATARTANATVNVTSSGGGGGGGGGSRASWTLMFYFDGDNDLEPNAFLNLDQLEQLPDNAEVNLVCQMKALRGFPQGARQPSARRFVIHHSGLRNQYVSANLATESPAGSATNLGNLDMGQVASVRNFVTWAQTNYPADNYAIDLWNHGSGWQNIGRGPSRAARGILYSDTFPAYLHNEDMATALTATERIDLLMMDACNMQMAEVAYQVRGVCDYVVASQDVMPSTGYPYQQILAPLLANPSRTPSQVASDIVAAYTTAAYANSSQWGLTHSVVRCDKMAPLATALASYCAALRAKDGTYHTAIANAREATQTFDGGEPADYGSVRDLVDFVQRVSTGTGDSQLTTTGNAVIAAVSQAVVAEAHVNSNASGAPSESGAHGLSIYLPNNAAGSSYDAWSLLRTDYLKQAFASPSGWAAWLDAFYGTN